EAAGRTVESLAINTIDPADEHVASPCAEAKRAIEFLACVVVASTQLADDDVDVVLLEAGKLRRRIERDAPAVDAGRAATELPRPLEDLLVEALSAAHHWGDELAPSGAEVFSQSIRDLRAR